MESTPTKLIAATTGMSAQIGPAMSRVKRPIIGRFSTRSATLAMWSEATRPQTGSGWRSKRSGPGWTSSEMSMARITAVVPDPGTPGLSMGMSAPPEAALLPASGAATPRGSPWPKVPSLSLVCFSME